GNKRLVAYVVPGSGADAGSPGDENSHWQTQWEMLYRSALEETAGRGNAPKDIDAVIIGWTGQQDAERKVEEWIGTTLERIARLEPGRVLEIGCGTGQLLTRIAPACAEYWGTDYAEAALKLLEQQLAASGTAWPQVRLFQRPGDDFEGIEAGAFDTVIINS